MSLIVATLGILSSVFGVIAENKKVYINFDYLFWQLQLIVYCQSLVFDFKCVLDLNIDCVDIMEAWYVLTHIYTLKWLICVFVDIYTSNQMSCVLKIICIMFKVYSDLDWE